MDLEWRHVMDEFAKDLEWDKEVCTLLSYIALHNGQPTRVDLLPGGLDVKLFAVEEFFFTSKKREAIRVFKQDKVTGTNFEFVPQYAHYITAAGIAFLREKKAKVHPSIKWMIDGSKKPVSHVYVKRNTRILDILESNWNMEGFLPYHTETLKKGLPVVVEGEIFATSTKDL